MFEAEFIVMLCILYILLQIFECFLWRVFCTFWKRLCVWLSVFWNFGTFHSITIVCSIFGEFCVWMCPLILLQFGSVLINTVCQQFHFDLCRFQVLACLNFCDFGIGFNIHVRDILWNFVCLIQIWRDSWIFWQFFDVLILIYYQWFFVMRIFSNFQWFLARFFQLWDFWLALL